MGADARQRAADSWPAVRFAIGLVATGAVATVAVAMAFTIGLPLVSDRFSVVVSSGSMSPAIKKGDVVVLAPAGDEPLGPPSVILFPAPTGDTLHRIHDVKPDGRYETKGDANPAPDTTLVDPGDVKGTGRLLVPRIAIPIIWADEGRWHLVVLWVLVATFVIYASRWGLSDAFDPWLLADARRRAATVDERERPGVLVPAP